MRKCLVDGYATRIRCCSAARDVSGGRILHRELRSVGEDENTFLGNLLVHMYGSFGHVADAQASFDAIPGKNVFSWNILMSVFINNGHLVRARMIYDKMPQRDLVSWNTIYAAYTRVGNIDCAQGVFDAMPEQTIVAWNTMISLYAQKRQMQKFEEMFDKMPVKNVVSWNSLVSGYIWCKQLQRARAVFQLAPSRNVVIWNTMFTALFEDGEHVAAARQMYEEMPERDIVSWTALIVACARQGQMARAKEMFLKMPLLDEISLAAMISVYAREGRMEEARDLHDKTASEDPSSWNAMMVGYAQNGQGRKALAMFGLMDLEGITFNKVTLFSIFDASIELVGLVEGRALHGLAAECGLLYQEVEIGNALIKMYGKCGSLVEAKAVFEDISEQRTLVSWNSLATSYSQNGEGGMAVQLFRSLVVEGEKPDVVTFTIALTGCSQDGLVETGVECFRSMAEYEVPATLDHYMCMVDLLGRVGMLAPAEELMESMPFEPRHSSWRSLLASCKVHSDVELAARLKTRAGHDYSSGSFVMLSNIYCEA